MKKYLFGAILLVFCLSTSVFAGKLTDSAKINHVLDGNINEWSPGRFETDKETNIQFAADHDANNLYLAIKVTDQQLQMKMMSLGMDLFIDTKGRKRERTGIGFPLKREGGGGRGFRPGGESGEGGRPDPKEMRERLAATMILLKTFGFDDKEDQNQLISQPNSVNVAFDWDEANNFYIEYLIPVGLLGGQTALNGKPLGIGWKINGMEMPNTGGATAVTTQLVGVPAGSGRPSGGGSGRTGGARAGGGNTGGGGANFGSVDSRMKEQSFWTKYVMSF
jgi:hypothetical protein